MPKSRKATTEPSEDGDDGWEAEDIYGDTDTIDTDPPVGPNDDDGDGWGAAVSEAYQPR